MTHTKGNVIQYNVYPPKRQRRGEYYPFGMQTANSWTRENTTGNNFLANGGTELNTTSNLYDLAYRNYDPVLGRMNGVDPMASKYSSLTPYNFSFNDPVTFADPSGADPADYYFYGGYFTYDDWIPHRNLGWQTSLDRSGAGGREFGQSLSSFGGGGYWYGDLNLDLNAMADGAHFFGFSNGLLTSHTHLSPTEVLGLGSAYNEAFVGGTTGPILSDFTGGPRLWQGSNGDYVTFSGGVAMVPGSNVTYSSYLAARSVDSEFFNSPAMRGLIADVYTLDLTVGAALLGGGTHQWTLNLITRGEDRGFHLTTTSHTTVGAQFSAGINLGKLHFLGSVSDLKFERLLGPSRTLSVDALIVNGNVTALYDSWEDSILKPTFIGQSGGFGIGVGLSYSEGMTVRKIQSPFNPDTPLNNWLKGKGY